MKLRMAKTMYRRTRHSQQRKGASIIPVIAFYAIALAMIGVWVKSALGHQRLVRRWHEKAKAVWLAEAGVRRAVAYLKLDANFKGETWEIPAARLAGPFAAQVEIQIKPYEPNGEELEQTASQSVSITAVARYPANAPKRVQATKAVKYQLPELSDRSGEST